MVLDEQLADEIAVVMAAISVSFMVPAMAYAYALRNKITKALLIIATSKHVYRYLFMVLGFAAAGSIAHLTYHIGEFQSIPLEVELVVHIAIDSSFIFVAVSLFMTFKTAYATLNDEKESAIIENIFREAASKLQSKDSSKSNASQAS